MKQMLKTLILLIGLAVWATSAFASAYSTTGAGTSTIGTASDYASINAAVIAVNTTGATTATVTTKSLTTNVATLTFTTGPTFAANNEVIVNTGDAIFDGTFLVVAATATTITYAKVNANVASAAQAGTITLVGGSRDASAWEFQINNDLTETVNSGLECTVNASGSITFRPAATKRVTVTFTQAADNAGTSGRFVIGSAVLVTHLTKTDNITWDGCNVSGGATRDLVVCDTTGTVTSGYLLACRGNDDGLNFKNLIAINFNTSANAGAISLRQDATSAGTVTNFVPDNWTVTNCWLQSTTSTSGTGINGITSTGTPTAGIAMSGWTISNNTIIASSRAISLTAAGGDITNNTIRQGTGIGSTAGLQAAAYLHLGTNSATSWTENIDRNVFDININPNASGGDAGPVVLNIGTSGGTYNITNNTFAGYSFTGAAADTQYQIIRVGGTNTSFCNIEHNSFNQTNTSSVTGAAAGNCYVIGRPSTSATPATLVIKNNIIRTTQVGANAIFAKSSASLTIDGNDIVSSANYGYIGTPAVQTVTTKTITSNVATLSYSGASVGFVAGQTLTVALPQATVTTKSLTSNVATLFYTGTTFAVNESITVAAVDAVFNGTFFVTAVGAGSIQYAKNNANVADTTSTGTIDDSATGLNGSKTLTIVVGSQVRYAVANQGNVASTATGGTLTDSGTPGTATTYASFSAWQGAGFDVAGQNVDPTATTGGTWASAQANSPGDLHFNGAPTNLNVSSVANVCANSAHDVDNETRTGNGIPGADEFSASASYAWTGATSTDMNDATNWTPNRTTKKWNDVLNFNAGGSQTVGFVDQHVGGFNVSNSTQLTLQSNTTTTMVPALTGVNPLINRLIVVNSDQSAGTADLTIAAGASVTLLGGTGTRIDCASGTTASILGNFVDHPTTNAGVNNLLVGRTGGAVVFGNGSTCTYIPDTTGSAIIFGTSSSLDTLQGSTAGGPGVQFASGSTYHQGATSAGVRSTQTPSNPFQGSGPTVECEFKLGSTFVQWIGTPSVSSRTFGYGGNVIFRNTDSPSLTGGGGWVVGGTVSTQDSLGTQGTVSIGMTGGTGVNYTWGGVSVPSGTAPALTLAAFIPGTANNLNITGNVDLGSGALFTPSSAATLTINLNGSSAQTVNGGGKTYPNVTINNAAGVVMSGVATVSTLATLTSGNVTTSGNTLTVPDLTGVVRTSGFVIGTLTRNITTVTGSRLYPIGTGSDYTPVTLNLTTATLSAGTISASTTATDSTHVLDASRCANRFWTLATSGLSGDEAGALEFDYVDNDITGLTETALTAGRWTGTASLWNVLGGTVNTGSNFVGSVPSDSGNMAGEWTLADNAGSLPVELDSFRVE